MDMKKLSENIEAIFEGKLGTFYHGTPHKINTFVDDFVGDGNAEYGPGIYFDNNAKVAKGYAGENGFVYVCTLTFNNELTHTTKFDKVQIEKMIKNSPDEYAWSNWSEDENSARSEAIKNYISSYGNDMLEIMTTIWADWYHDYSTEFVRNLVKLGYDGTIYKNTDGEGTDYAVVYNPNSIQVNKVLSMKENNE